MTNLQEPTDKSDNVDDVINDVIRSINEDEVYENYKRDLKGKRILRPVTLRTMQYNSELKREVDEANKCNLMQPHRVLSEVNQNINFNRQFNRPKPFALIPSVTARRVMPKEDHIYIDVMQGNWSPKQNSNQPGIGVENGPSFDIHLTQEMNRDI